MKWGMSPDKLEQFQKEHSAWGYDVHRVEKSDIPALEPSLASDEDFLPDFAVQVRSTEEGTVEASQAAQLMVADAQQRFGARLVSAAATKLILRGDDAAAVTGVLATTSAGEDQPLLADHVVVAAGVGSVALCASAGVTLPLHAPPGLLVRSRPVPGGRRVLNSVVYTSRGHVRQTADGRVLGGSDFAGGDPGPDPEAEAQRQFELVRKSFQPEIAALLEFERHTVGYRPTPDDGIPILGDTGVGGLSVAVMHSGVTNAALVGELLAQRVLTGKDDPVLEDFSLKRFGKKVAV